MMFADTDRCFLVFFCLIFSPQVYQINSESYITYDQPYGRGLGKDTVKNGMASFSWLTCLGLVILVY